MKAITLWQPWASLCVDPFGLPQPPKRIETRSWPAPASLIGQRIAIHAATRPVNDGSIAETELGQFSIWHMPANRSIGLLDAVSYISRRNERGDLILDTLPLGAVVGSVVVTECMPMIDVADRAATDAGRHLIISPSTGELLIRTGSLVRESRDARYFAYEHDDVSNQLPYGDFELGRYAWLLTDPVLYDQPVPAAGRQGIWDWEPPTGCER